MADGDKRKALATATTGYGLVGAGALLSEHGIKGGTKLAGGKRSFPPALSLVKAPFSLGRRNARAAYLGGRAISAVGGVGAAAGTHKLFTRRKNDQQVLAKAASQFIATGLQGQAEALREKKNNLSEKSTPIKARAVPIVSGAVIGGGAGHGVHQLLDRSKFKHTKLRPAIVATGATAAIGASLPITNRLMHHITPGYKVTPTGVTREQKTKIKRASTQASIAEGRSSKGADPRMFRQQVVGKMADASEVHVNTTMRKTGRKMRMPSRYEINQSVGKSLITINTKPDTGMTPQQARAQLNAKKRKLVTDVAATGLGTGGLALLAASSKHSPLPKYLHASLRQKAGTTAVLGGGVGAINGIQGARIAHRDIKAQEKAQGFAKSDTLKVPSFRGSYLQTRRLRNGTIKPVRVNGGVVR